MDAKPVPTAAAEAVAATGVTPAQAREETLGWAVAAATASSDHWLVIPAHEAGSPVVVVPMADRDAFLKELGDTGRAGVPLPPRPRPSTAGPSAAARSSASARTCGAG